MMSSSLMPFWRHMESILVQKTIDCHLIWFVRWRQSCWSGVFGQVDGSLVAMVFFFSSSSFLSLEPWYSYRAFKNSVMSSSLYLFWIWSLFFLFLFVLILMLLEVFFFNFIHQHLVSFNFCIQYGPYSFDWCFLIFCIYLFFLILSFRILFHFILFPNLVLIFVLFFF
jgi:hypothetical protein